jgi:crossover junction endodeoxyribonuclease RusA
VAHPADTPADHTPARTWRLEMPPGQELLNANDRIHWAKRNRITRQLRSDAHLMARHRKIPRLDRARIDGIYQPPPKSRRRDAGNWYPTYKAQIDGLVDAGVFADDDHTRVDGPHMSIGDPFPRGRIVLVITELQAEEASTS